MTNEEMKRILKERHREGLGSLWVLIGLLVVNVSYVVYLIIQRLAR